MAVSSVWKWAPYTTRWVHRLTWLKCFDQVIPAADKDIVKVFTKRISKKFNLMLETKVTAVEAKEDGIYVTMEGKKSTR